MKKAIGALSFVVIFLLLTGTLNLLIVGENNPSMGVAENQTRSDVVYITDTYVINQTSIDPLTGERGKYGFDASVVVTSTGKLVVENATIYILSDVNHRYNLTVEGSLYFYNATFTIGHGLIQPYYPFSFNIKGPGTGDIQIIKSKLLFPGWFNVTDKNGNVLIKDSIFAKMHSSPTDYPSPPGYGPRPFFYNSKAYIWSTRFLDLYTPSSSGISGIGFLNDTTGYSVTTTDVEINNFVKNPNSSYINYWNFSAVKNVHVVVSYTNSTDYDRSASFVMYYESREVGNLTFEGDGNPLVGDIPIENFALLDNEYITPNDFYNKIQSGEIKIYITKPNQGTLTIASVSLEMGIEGNLVKYGVEAFSFNVIKSALYMRDMYVDVDFQPRINLGTTHHMFYISQGSKLYFLNLTVNDTGNNPRYDTCFLVDDLSSEAYILRYGVINVYFHNHPVNGLKISAIPYPVDINSDLALIAKMGTIMRDYITSTSVIPGMSLGHISGNQVWDITVNGNVKLPLLSDIVNRSEEPNSKFVGIYNITVHNETEEFYHVTWGLNYYPWLLIENNTLICNVELPKYKDIDLGIGSMMVSTPEPYMVGREIDVKVNVTNYGTELAEDSKISIYINGALYDTFDMGNIDGGAFYEHTYAIPGAYFSTQGMYNISVMVWQIWDYNTSNNISFVNIKVGNVLVSTWDVSTTIRYHASSITLFIDSTYSWSGVNISLYLDSQYNLINYTFVNLNAGTTQVNMGWYISQNVASGPHALLAYLDGNVLIGSYNINVYKDVNLQVSSVEGNPSEGYVESTVVITATISNLGVEDPATATIYIGVYDPYGTMIVNQSFSYSPGQSIYQLDVVPRSSGTYKVVVMISSDEDYDTTNNMMSILFDVHPTPFAATAHAENEYVNGTDITINVTVYSEINATIYVNLYISSWGMVIGPTNPSNPMLISANSVIIVTFNIPQSTYQRFLQGHSFIVVNYNVNITSNKTGNAVYSFSAPSFVIKEKTNFAISSLSIKESGKEINKVAEGVLINITFEVRNIGGLSGNLSYVILDGDKAVKWGQAGILAPGNSIVIEYNYTIYGVNLHEIKIRVNPNGSVEESNYEDNVISKDIEVITPEMKILFTSYSQENNENIYVGDHLIVVVKVINVNATQSQGKTVYVKNVTVTLNLPELGSYTAVTNEYGIATFNIPVTKAGSYSPQLSLNYGGKQTEYTPQGVVISVEEKPFEIPWLWIIVIIIAAAIGGFFLYGYITFKKEAPEYMVCGNCGHLVPADAEKCPYCGVVFEKEKVKCPACGSWIDEDSKFCPVCGTVFLPTDDPEYEKYVKLKENYEKYIGKYKEEAKKYIGEEYTEEEFYKWWKTHPEFISFLEWVKRQEEKIEGDTVKCPVCGAMNPKGAKICRVCGSPLPQEGVEEEEEEKEIEIKPPPLSPEEVERLKRPGVVTVEELAERKGISPEEKKEEEVEEKPPGVEKAPEETEKPKEIKEEKPKEEKPEKPVVKKKVIKKVIAVKEEEKKEES